MVYLNRIYTKSGDDGETGLGDGARVAKTSQRVVAYGTVDELNAALGVAIAAGLPDQCEQLIIGIQNNLFDLGADLCVPLPSEEGPEPDAALRVKPDQVTELERRIDAATDRLEPLTSFILPGGTEQAASLHLARTLCRRAEIEVWRLAEREEVNPLVPIYLNRLSDLLFVAARLANDEGRADVLWSPGTPA
ncbi:cob(I)yrinic acid a,c-diamide adenosyltransferase [Stratiformator vulcanicus]|uniref:Corrinoid adenosyltransferase n=1 Tax=Stratiformator vulcanicus TaxID=2527980 RepID=A0A517R735_9PLAN|nr:cob(I)yrinic acid a,c-diamide adenosyltransferase [Stratiformator vulcanicus]QDT39706.1 Cob(I)yrinic acid a,c-diamide adenosyltransferase [Stratiformator vulcanicus]